MWRYSLAALLSSAIVSGLPCTADEIVMANDIYNHTYYLRCDQQRQQEPLVLAGRPEKACLLYPNCAAAAELIIRFMPVCTLKDGTQPLEAQERKDWTKCSELAIASLSSTASAVVWASLSILPLAYSLLQRL